MSRCSVVSKKDLWHFALINHVLSSLGLPKVNDYLPDIAQYLITIQIPDGRLTRFLNHCYQRGYTGKYSRQNYNDITDALKDIANGEGGDGEDGKGYNKLIDIINKSESEYYPENHHNNSLTKKEQVEVSNQYTRDYYTMINLLEMGDGDFAAIEAIDGQHGQHDLHDLHGPDGPDIKAFTSDDIHYMYQLKYDSLSSTKYTSDCKTDPIIFVDVDGDSYGFDTHQLLLRFSRQDYINLYTGKPFDDKIIDSIANKYVIELKLLSWRPEDSKG